MSEPLAFRNGELIPAHQLTVAVNDPGFVQGATVAERMRTFHGKLFRLEEHLDRLQRSLATVGITLPYRWSQLAEAADQLVAHNHALLDAGSDLGLCIFVTPGCGQGPLTGMHTNQLDFRSFAEKYRSGQKLAITEIRQVPTACWPAELKCRSRMHYYLADRLAAQQIPGARALLLDLEGYVSEASTANLLAYSKQDGFVSPPLEKILPGISMSVVQELAQQLNIPFVYRNLDVPAFLAADEILLTSTSPCVLPVASVDRNVIGDGRPGVMFSRLHESWNQLVGIDIQDQARRCAESSG